MPAAMAGEERRAFPSERPHHNRVGRVSKRCLHVHLARVREPFHVIKPASSDDADLHRLVLSVRLRLRRLLSHSLSPSISNYSTPPPQLNRSRPARAQIGRLSRAGSPPACVRRAQRAQSILLSLLPESIFSYFRASSSGTSRIP